MISPLQNREAYYPQPCCDGGSWQLLLNQTGPHPSLSPVPQRCFVSFIISLPLWLSNGMLFYSINTKLSVTLGSDGVMGAMVESRCWGEGGGEEKGSGPCSHAITADQPSLSIGSHPFLSAALLKWQCGIQTAGKTNAISGPATQIMSLHLKEQSCLASLEISCTD